MNTTTLTPETKIEVMDLAEKLLQAHGIYAEVYSEGPTDFCVAINWGDWKHEHLATKWLMHDCLNLEQTASWETEEDGSDCYSGVHRFTIPNYPSRLLSYLEYKKPVLCATDMATDIGSIAESLRNYRIDSGIGIRNGIRASYHTELEFITGECKR